MDGEKNIHEFKDGMNVIVINFVRIGKGFGDLL